MKSIERGHLYVGQPLAAEREQLGLELGAGRRPVERAARRAFTCSPRSGSGMPNTATSATAG